MSGIAGDRPTDSEGANSMVKRCAVRASSVTRLHIVHLVVAFEIVVDVTRVVDVPGATGVNPDPPLFAIPWMVVGLRLVDGIGDGSRRLGGLYDKTQPGDSQRACHSSPHQPLQYHSLSL